MSIHVFIGEPYHTISDLIEYVLYDTIKQHLVFDKDNRLKYIKKLNAHTDEIAQLTINNIYEFKNGLPMPFYNYFSKYYDNIGYSLILDDNQLDEMIIISELIINITDFESNEYVHNDILEKYKTRLIGDNIDKDIWIQFENFATEYNNINKLFNLNNLDNMSNSRAVSPDSAEQHFYFEKLDTEHTKLKNTYIDNILKTLNHKYQTIVI